MCLGSSFSADTEPLESVQLGKTALDCPPVGAPVRRRDM